MSEDLIAVTRVPVADPSAVPELARTFEVGSVVKAVLAGDGGVIAVCAAWDSVRERERQLQALLDAAGCDDHKAVKVHPAPGAVLGVPDTRLVFELTDVSAALSVISGLVGGPFQSAYVGEVSDDWMVAGPDVANALEQMLEPERLIVTSIRIDGVRSVTVQSRAKEILVWLHGPDVDLRAVADVLEGHTTGYAAIDPCPPGVRPSALEDLSCRRNDQTGQLLKLGKAVWWQRLGNEAVAAGSPWPASTSVKDAALAFGSPADWRGPGREQAEESARSALQRVAKRVG